MSEELINMCLGLSLEERLQLRDILTKSVTSNPVKSPLRGSILLRSIEKILNARISLVSRNPMDVWARTMVAYQMILEGYTCAEVGRQLVKDHSTITHLKHKMQDALSVPMAYQDIIPIWNEFQKTIDYDFHERPN